jgi:hypothetical protein
MLPKTHFRRQRDTAEMEQTNIIWYRVKRGTAAIHTHTHTHTHTHRLTAQTHTHTHTHTHTPFTPTCKKTLCSFSLYSL